MYSATGVISALLHRERTGEGQHIDMALLDVRRSYQPELLNFLHNRRASQAIRQRASNIVPYQSLQDKGWLVLCSLSATTNSSGNSVLLLVWQNGDR